MTSTATTTLILGGGWGGLTAAHHLRNLVDAKHRVVVFERNSTFSLGVSNLELMTGTQQLDRVQRDMAELKRPGIEVVQADVTGLDPASRTVDTSTGSFQGDHVVVALGAELAPETVPGFAAAAHNLYDPAGAAAIHEHLQALDGGRIAVLVAGAPFRCPAAPYEAAMLLEAWAREHAVRHQIEIDLYTPEAIPMAVAGPAVGEALRALLADRGIDAHFSTQVTRIDAASRTIHFGDDEAGYDVLVGIPPHRAPAPVTEAGLVDATGYIPVHPQSLELLADPETLEVQYPGVYAIGDTTAVRLMNSMLLPKAGVFAEGQAQVVAATIAAHIDGQPTAGAYSGEGFCYVDVGDGVAAYGSGNFYAYPGPRVSLEEPSAEGKQAKQEYAALLDTWFRS